jgi:deoxyribodipyrimidine photolyase-related protein
VPSVRSVIVLPYDRLSRTHGLLSRADPSQHEILMVDSLGMLGSRPWHAQRLHLVLSAAAHVRADLEADGFTVHHRQASSTAAGIAAFRRQRPEVRLIASEPSSHGVTRAWQAVGVELEPDESFLTPRADFARWLSGQRTPRMDQFYRWQRRRLGILMDADQPVGGRWSLDSENRLPPPKAPYPWPEPLRHEPDDLDRQVWQQLQAADLSLWGDPPNGTWATTRAGALRQLRHFLDTSFAGFGPYEDAMPSDSWSGHHSLLSPYLNIGLLDPQEVVAATLARYAEGDIPLASCEGFLRQVIGWREYVNGLYWTLPRDYRVRNGLGAHRPLPRALGEPGGTSMACVGSVVQDVHDRGWVHHIPRLMVLANLALLAGIEPGDFLGWMRRTFVDAADWVMVPNVIGMGVHADDGLMMTKPYAAGGAYLSRMGRYCGGCRFDPKQRTGPDACPFTTLYWDFLDRHRDRFGANPRLAQQVRGLDRLTDLPEVRARAADVLAMLDAGTL